MEKFYYTVVPLPLRTRVCFTRGLNGGMKFRFVERMIITAAAELSEIFRQLLMMGCDVAQGS